MHYFLLLVEWLAACTSAASRPPTLIHLASTTSPQAQSNGSVAEGTPWPGYCTKFERWSVPKLELTDCGGVLDWFYIHTMHEGGSRKEEFIAPGAKTASLEGTVWTPRKYTFGTVHPLLIPTFHWGRLTSPFVVHQFIACFFTRHTLELRLLKFNPLTSTVCS